MSISTENLVERHSDEHQGDNLSLPVPDRRLDRRAVSAFRPGCVVLDKKVTLGMIRNISSNGVMIELDHPVEVGQRISYFWNEHQLVDGTVVWSEGKRHGIENDTETSAFNEQFAYRSVRVPCTMQAEIWVNGELQRVEVVNMSLGGMQVSGLHAQRGALLTVKVAGLELYNATVRWVDGRMVGIQFSNRLGCSQLASILSHKSVQFDRLDFAHTTH